MMHRDARTVLVVDDDEDIREVLTLLLLEEGYDVVCAAHGGEALVLLRAGLRPCLVVLDLLMPVCDGWAFCAAVEQDPSIPPPRVVLFSAAPAADVAPHACRDVVGVLPKPVGVQELVTTVRRASVPPPPPPVTTPHRPSSKPPPAV